MRQGCPLALYLFLIMGKILNMHTQLATQEGLIRGIKLPTVPLFEVISQYADDTTLFLKGEERYVSSIVELLDRFCTALGLLLNWSKSTAFWQHKNLIRPPWTNQFR
jgi:hypothetical protein